MCFPRQCKFMLISSKIVCELSSLHQFSVSVTEKFSNFEICTLVDSERMRRYPQLRFDDDKQWITYSSFQVLFTFNNQKCVPISTSKNLFCAQTNSHVTRNSKLELVPPISASLTMLSFHCVYKSSCNSHNNRCFFSCSSVVSSYSNGKTRAFPLQLNSTRIAQPSLSWIHTDNRVGEIIDILRFVFHEIKRHGKQNIFCYHKFSRFPFFSFLFPLIFPFPLGATSSFTRMRILLSRYNWNWNTIIVICS